MADRRQNLMEFHRVDYEVHVRGLLSLLNRMPDTKLTTCFEKEGVAVAWSLVVWLLVSPFMAHESRC